MPRRSRSSDSRARLLSLLLVLALATGIATGLAVSISGTTLSAASLPSCVVADTLTAHRGLGDWSRAVLDTRFRLASVHIPKDLRSTASAGLNGGEKVRAFVIPDLKAMASAARKARANFSVESAYRSYATQRHTFAHWLALHGRARALKESARAGHSEHQLGTTLDLRSTGGGAPWNMADWAKTKAGAWLKANAWKYGFVMSYPKGKTAVTCYMYEPWHYRYVGRAAAAKVHASGLTLRQYLWKQQNAPTPTPTPSPSPSPTPTPEPTPTPTPSPSPTPTPVPTP